MDQKKPSQEQEVDAKLSFKSLKSTFLNRTENQQQQQKEQQHRSKNGQNPSMNPSQIELSLFYKSSKSNNKKCLILNYDTFSNHQKSLPPRSWSSTDVQLLESTLKDHLNFTTVNVQNNLTYNKTIKLLQTESNDVANREIDLFLVIILSSHKISPNFGHLELYTADRPLKLELIVDQITRPSATLARVPKIFLIDSSIVELQTAKNSTLVTDAAHENPRSKIGRQFLIPRYADLLIAYMTSNVLDPESLKETGSKPIRFLTHHLRNSSADFHLMYILTMLAADLQEKDEVEEVEGEKKTLPNSTDHLLQVMSTLTGLVSLRN